MSGSGRQVGDCPHARTRGYCPDCLRVEVADLERQRNALRVAMDRLAGVDLLWAWRHEQSIEENCQRMRKQIVDVARDALACCQ